MKRDTAADRVAGDAIGLGQIEGGKAMAYRTRTRLEATFDVPTNHVKVVSVRRDRVLTVRVSLAAAFHENPSSVPRRHRDPRRSE
jgi:hypothetical protein